jgi:hypothetical protein
MTAFRALWRESRALIALLDARLLTIRRDLVRMEPYVDATAVAAVLEGRQPVPDDPFSMTRDVVCERLREQRLLQKKRAVLALVADAAGRRVGSAEAAADLKAHGRDNHDLCTFMLVNAEARQPGPPRALRRSGGRALRSGSVRPARRVRAPRRRRRHAVRRTAGARGDPPDPEKREPSTAGTGRAQHDDQRPDRLLARADRRHQRGAA